MRQDSPTADATAQGPTGEPPTPARPRDPDSIRAELERANAELSRRQKQLEQTLDELQATNERLNEEMQKRQHAETELRIAHKLEAVGRLAAGIAHEINTPTHFIGHNITFLSEAYGDLRELVSAFEDLLVATESCTGCAAARSDGKAAVDDADLDFLDGEVPVAFDAVRDGIGTISRIVGAMREFSHPDQASKELGDINRALRSTLAVAHPEYRFIAEVETDFGEVPMVRCHLGELNQAFLNIIVNAAHAIEAQRAPDDPMGVIRVATRSEQNTIAIEISDTGCGFDEAVGERIFDPFFTTKEVGVGTGQGLSLTRAIVVDRHGGTIDVASRVGEGTTFTLRIPV